MTLVADSPFGRVPGEELQFPRGYGYGVRLGSQWFRLAPSQQAQLMMATTEAQAPRANDSENALENTLEVGHTFARADLTGGEGLDYFPQLSLRRQRGEDAIKFFDSNNVSIMRPEGNANDYRIKLSRVAEDWYTAAAGTVLDVVASRTALYVADGQTVRRFLDTADSTPDSSTNINTSTIDAIAVDQNDNGICKLANGELWYKPTGTATWTQIATTGLDANEVVEQIWFVKGRIMFETTNSTNTAAPRRLREYDPGVSGTPAAPTFSVTVTTIDSFAADVETVIDASTAILVATSDGFIRSYVPQTDTAGTSPTLTVRGRLPLPQGETAYALGHSFGQVMILTREIGNTNGELRCYTGELLDERFDYVVGNLDLRREWTGAADITGLNNRVITGRDNMWFIVRESDTNAYLWRIDLVTLGLFRHTQLESNDHAESLLRFREEILWLASDDVRRVSSTTYNSTGYLITPNINFNLDTPINWVSIVTHAILDTAGVGTQIEVLGTTTPEAINDWQDVSWRTLARVTTATDSGLEFPLEGLVGTTLALQLRFTAHTADTGTPSLTRVSVRALPQKRDFILELPINISDLIEQPMTRPLRIPGWGDVIHKAVLDLDGQWVEAEVFDPPLSFRGIVDQILEPTTYIAERGSTAVMCAVRLRGQRVTTSGSPAAGDSGLGIGLLGVDLLGVEA